MPKLKQKTNKACSKRYKKTATGKFVAKQGGKKHLNAKMSRKVVRRLNRKIVLSAGNAARLKELIPFA